MVFVSSLAASFGLPNHEAISAAKGGLESMVDHQATYAKRKIQVNVVAPALTETNLHLSYLLVRLQKSQRRNEPMARSYKPKRLQKQSRG